MKDLAFNFGRMSFSSETLEMTPSLPDNLESRIRLYRINQDGIFESPFFDFSELDSYVNSGESVWLHLAGNLNKELIDHLRIFFDFSDEQTKLISKPHAKSFTEEFANGIFLTFQKPVISAKVDALETINFFISKNVLLSRQFSHDYIFNLLSHRLMEKGELSANYKPDTLCAELIEDIIESYIEILKIGAMRLELIQSKIIRHPGKQELLLINQAQQIIWIFLNKIWPLETLISTILRSRNPIISKEGKAELELCLSQAEAVVRLFETNRAMSYNLMDVYVSGLSLKTNEATTVLTIIATLFLPPTLIAGIYGMNFNIPEVHASYGYYVCLLAMVIISGGLLFWFKKKGFID